MAERAITRFIDLAIIKSSPGTSVTGFGDLMVITDSSLITTTTRIKTFTTLASIIAFFGAASEEDLAADAFFNQDPFLVNRPEQISFGRFADDVTAAVLECGDSPETDVEVWKLITDGETGITVDTNLDDIASLNFSAVTTMDDVATIIDAALSGSGCHWQVNRFVFTSDTTGAASAITLLATVQSTSGTDISGTGFLDGDTIVSVENPGGSILSQGQVAEDFVDSIVAIEEVDAVWRTMGALAKFRDTDDAEDMADEIASRQKIFMIATNDINTLTLGSTSTFAYYIKNADYKRVGTIYDDNATLYPDMSWLGKQLPKPVGSTNWAYQILPGIAEGAVVNIDPVVLTQDQIDGALDVNCNLYTATLSKNFTYFGTMGGGRNDDKDGEFIHLVRNIDFIQAIIEDGLLDFLIEKDIVLLTDAGITMADNRLKNLLQVYGVEQGIFTEGTVVTSWPKASEISSVDKNNSILPDGTFEAELQGGVNKIILRGKVYV